MIAEVNICLSLGFPEANSDITISAQIIFSGILPEKPSKGVGVQHRGENDVMRWNNFKQESVEENLV